MPTAADPKTQRIPLAARTGRRKLQAVVVALTLALGLAASADAQISFGIGIRQAGVSIGINFDSYPYLTQVPGYPVYYAPQADSNYFFYDGLYWVFQDDNWYASSWYNGPWDLIDPYYVPVFLLRVPVLYYRRPPVYFRGWGANAPPRWNEHWGRDWEERRRGWNQWDRRSAPPPAPLPGYQRQYSGSRYPRSPEQQRSIQSERYRYQPRDPVARQFWQQQPAQQRPIPRGRQPQLQGQPPPVRQQSLPQYRQNHSPMQAPPAQPAQPAQQPPRRQAPGGGRPYPQRARPRPQEQAPQQGPALQGAPSPQQRGPRKDSVPRGQGGDGKNEDRDRGPR